MIRPIAPGLSPNTTKEDAFLALSLLCAPWKYKRGKATLALEQWFRTYLSMSYAISFTSARGALYAILKNLPLGKGDEVILQAFTCVAVVQPILSLQAKPVFIDCTENFTMSPEDLEKKITPKTKVIIVQHTFGYPGISEKVKEIAKKNNIFLIEDVAHSIGSTYKNKKLGTFGDAAIFSFGRDKSFSSVSGGIAITNEKELGKKLRAFQRERDDASMQFVISNLLHVIFFSFLILPLYDVVSLGKVLLVFFQRIKLLSFPVDTKRLHVAPEEVKKMPQAMSVLMLSQLKRLEFYNKKRKTIAAQYHKELESLHIPHQYKEEIPYLRFPILVGNPLSMKKYFRKKRIYLGDWYSNVIDPKGIAIKKFGYMQNCSYAEYAALRIINLPTYPTMSKRDIQKVIVALRSYVRSSTN